MPPGAREYRKNAEMMPPGEQEYCQNAEMMPSGEREYSKNAEMMPPGAWEHCNDPCGVDPKQSLGQKILNSMAMLPESGLVAAGLGSSR